jgi:inorganic triphosphatase YgiF
MTESEIELKLRVRPEDLRRLSALPALGSSRGTTRTLESVYFDTPDLQLRRSGTVLRVRRDGKRYLQTLKSAGEGAALQNREESEMPISGNRPDLARLRRRFPALAAEELRPVFVSRVRRTVRRVNGIEVAFDTGEIRTPEGAAEQVSEVELELKSGQPREVFALALALAESVPFAIETRTKSERGYALAGNKPTGAVHAAPIELTRDANAGEAIGTIFRKCLDHLTANQGLALDTADAGSIHQMRVALRRTRSALGLLRELLPRDERKALAAEAKWLADILGDARDLDVLSSETLAPVRAAFPDDAALQALAAAGDAARARAQKVLAEAVGSPRYTRFVLRLGAFVESGAWQSEESAAALAARLLEKRAGQAKRLGKHFETLDVEGRHELRIALKKLRYAAEFFRSLFAAPRARKYLKRLTALQTALGRINDLETARRVLDGLVAAAPEADRLDQAGAAGRVIGWHTHAVAAAEGALVDEWRAFAATRPFWS